MSKPARALSGAAKNAYIAKVVKSALGEDHLARDEVARQLAAAIASLRVPVEAARAEAAADVVIDADAGGEETFDPFTPNVIVVLRTKGREAVLAVLQGIEREDQLRLLAHEQQLGLPEEAVSAAAIRDAIIAAAERRIANRRAAAR